MSLKSDCFLKEKLFLFGTKCILYPIDDNTIKSESLVSWCNDVTLLLDKYDVRCGLDSIVESTEEIIEMNQSEIQEEKECEKERYLDLNEKNLQIDCEDSMVDDSKIELHGEYSAVGFSYDMDFASETSEGDTNNSEKSPNLDEEIPYEYPTDLKIPNDIELPKTEKQAAKIEKTALFIANEGGQMEIYLKTKQSFNQKFDFLNFDHPLYKFYKFLVNKIKAAEYIPNKRHLCHLTKKELSPVLSQNGNSVNDILEDSIQKIDITNTAYYSLINKYKVQKLDKSDDHDMSKVPIEMEIGMKEEDPKEIIYKHYYGYYYNYYNQISQTPDGGKSANEDEICQAAKSATNTALEQYFENQKLKEKKEKEDRDRRRQLSILMMYIQNENQDFKEGKITESKVISSQFLEFLKPNSHYYTICKRIKENIKTEEESAKKKYLEWGDFLKKSLDKQKNKNISNNMGVGEIVNNLQNYSEVENNLLVVTDQISQILLASDAGKTKYEQDNKKPCIFPIQKSEANEESVKADRKRKAMLFLEKMKKVRKSES